MEQDGTHQQIELFYLSWTRFSAEKKKQFLHLVMLSMELSFSQFDGKFYEQTENTAMGNRVDRFWFFSNSLNA
jgi:hypothetical protein